MELCYYICGITVGVILIVILEEIEKRRMTYDRQ